MCAVYIQFYFFHFRMRPARTDPRYSVTDVIEMVQNGESDVDIEFDDTDASDEESDNDACVDKENQEPTDCTARTLDIEPQSNEHIKPRDRYRWQKKDFISPNTDFSGPALTDDATVLLRWTRTCGEDSTLGQSQQNLH